MYSEVAISYKVQDIQAISYKVQDMQAIKYSHAITDPKKPNKKGDTKEDV